MSSALAIACWTLFVTAIVALACDADRKVARWLERRRELRRLERQADVRLRERAARVGAWRAYRERWEMDLEREAIRSLPQTRDRRLARR